MWLAILFLISKVKVVLLKPTYTVLPSIKHISIKYGYLVDSGPIITDLSSSKSVIVVLLTYYLAALRIFVVYLFIIIDYS